MAAIASHPVDAKTFSDDGYTWEIKDSEWENMKRMAKAEYKNAEEQGRAIPIGYSKAKTVTLNKDGIECEGTAFAIQNDKTLRCEVRGLKTGYLTDYEN